MTEAKNKKQQRDFSDDLDVIRHIVGVESEDDDINSDYVYAKLDEKEEKYIVEMTINSMLVRKLFQQMITNIQRKKRKYQEIGAENKLTQKLDEKKEIVERLMEDAHQSYIKRVRIILARGKNRRGNYLIDAILSRIRELEEAQQEERQANKVLGYIKEKIQKQPQQ